MSSEKSLEVAAEDPVDTNDVIVPVRPLTLRQRISGLMCQVRSPPDNELAKCEAKLLSKLQTRYHGRLVELDDPKRALWTISMNDDKSTVAPVVLVHGFGAGSALWMHNLDRLSQHRPVYAIDLLGFGRSSRAQLSSDTSKTAEDWAETIEQWRLKMGIDKMYLLVHSLGGYIGSIYALRHPDRVCRLILVEPWGFAEPPKNKDGETVINRPLFIRMVIRLMFTFHPLSILRLAGPLGPGIIRKVRPDLGRKYAPTPEIAPYIYKYIHFCNARSPPSGETAFKRLVDKNGYPLVPMILRIGQLPLSVPITVILGQDSWVDADTGHQITKARATHHQVEENNARVDFHVVEEAGHHLYVEQSDHFNDVVNDILLKSDNVS